jgi:DNA-binding transcriptional regulator YdaS (Cro superfamily)
MELKEYFKDEPLGAVNEMAAYLGITNTWLSLLIHKHKRPSPELAVKIEKATQGLVTRYELRSDLFSL